VTSPGELSPPELDSLAETLPQRRVAVRVDAKVANAVRRGHPWVYADAIRSGAPSKQPGPDETAVPGQLAVVFDPKGRFAGIGLYDPDSPIRVRILHAGTPTAIDPAFWAQRLDRAAKLRRGLAAVSDTYRLLNGEGDGVGGLVIDRYSGWLSVKVYSLAWLPHLATILRNLREQQPFGFVPEGLVIRYARSIDRATFCRPEPPAALPITESGLDFEVSLRHGQKTGMFLDQRENRERVRHLASGARVLDLFCCNGGFGVYAAAGGATAVTSVDSSAPAIESTRRHFRLNRERFAKGFEHEAIVGDAFAQLDALRRSRRTFDLIVCDPPSFARNQAMVPNAISAYTRLVRGCATLLEPAGLLVQASCTSRVDAEQLAEVVHAGARQAGTELRIESITGHAVDHPHVHPEGRYLKAVYARRA
jgi:23S rRNA (cytosine1962-C5)-methyltransferase